MKELSMKIKCLLMLFLLSLTGLTTQGCNKGSSSPEPGVQASTTPGTSDQPTLILAGSKQGQSVGFVDVDGDGIDDKVVGAPYSTTTSSQLGSALVYKGNAAGYNTIPDMVLTGDDNLGYSFLTLGDVDGDGKNDFALGAIHGDGADVSLCGSVTIYKGGSNGQIIRKLSGEGPMDKFGFSISAADLNNDGQPDIVIGAPMNTNDPALYQGGAVYVFFGPDFSAGATLYASSKNKGLGGTVATGDISGDGIPDLLISVSGKVLVFNGGATFAPQTDAPDVAISAKASGFGKTVAVIGDIDGVPGGELAVGAPNAVISLATVTSRDVGSIYLLSKPTGTMVDLDASPSPAELLVRLDGETLFSRFGASIAALGDVDADGKPDFAAGAPMVDVNGNILSGKVYLFKGKDISPTATMANATSFPGKVRDHAYGTSLSAGSKGTILIGAPRSNGDTGGVDMVDPATGQTVAGGSSGGSTGGSGDCH